MVRVKARVRVRVRVREYFSDHKTNSFATGLRTSI
jgi:hypothetical protein